jgi:aerobic carbon-monoxide dehydrogenase large subunit
MAYPPRYGRGGYAIADPGRRRPTPGWPGLTPHPARGLPGVAGGEGYGSIAQGLGQVMFEEASYTPGGLPEASTLLDYLLPTAADMPPVELLETQTPNPNVPFGSKGAGEAGCIGVPPAVVSAVCDALDVDHIDMPLTPETVWGAAHPTR